MLSNHLPIIHHFLPQDGAEYHLEILREAIVIQIIEVDAHFVGIDHGVVVLYGDFLHGAGIACGLFLGHIG